MHLRSNVSDILSHLPAIALAGVFLISGCGHPPSDPAAGAPPANAGVVPAGDPSVVSVDDTSLFKTVAATAYNATSSLSVTGQVQPDVSREIPVVLLANGRVLATYVRLGDYVHKGQLVLEVQSNDIAGAFDQYLKAKSDERLAHTVLDRDQLLYDHGAIPKSQLEIAQDSEQDAQADEAAALQQLKVLGVDPDHPSEVVKVYAPASGYIIQQNVTDASTAGNSLTGSPNAFMIADLSHVWVLCDVYENDLAQVHVGQAVDIHLTAFPDKVLTGTVGDIGAVLDPNLRTAKVRIQVPNPGSLMRVGMFATATIHGRVEQHYAEVPADAVLHLHDRDWVYIPTDKKTFRRVPVVAGAMLPGNMQQILSGLEPGQSLVSNALELQNTAAQ